ncbi:thiamine pyrophosphate-binding protein [Methanobacterium sp.]|uniref:thiamine pyrophosphate-binding protein n=1 Tax=Methanobacterium sp. TaxID=2164 RepID=UPI0025E73E2B|nr:thiamine pyrophosphate-binding protein [Methanobacterium sp.]MBI5459615.1 thiamine pyrophosphate-binding protein [Methanobacterium sp.]
MQTAAKMRLADALVKILEKEETEFIFGYPGEQILPFYQALRKSSVKHVLMRHEQGAAHAADGYARASSQPGICVASAGPGALNMVMGVATAFKDSVPLLVITGDVSSQFKGENVFQDVDINSVFEPITLQSHLINNPKEGISIIQKAITALKNGKTGPIHLNFPKDILQEEVDTSLLDEWLELTYETDDKLLKNNEPGESLLKNNEPDEKILNQVRELVETSQKPLILSGAGVLWSHASEDLQIFAEKHQIPVVTTYPARGVISEDHPLSLGLIGLRGTEAANFAGENADIILVLGSRLSERTLMGLGKGPIIQVNLDEAVLTGDVNIKGDVKEFLEKIKETTPENTDEWLNELQKYDKNQNVATDFEETPIKPQRAIMEILQGMNDSILVNDAGSHTTWVNLLMKVREPSSLIFSGGFGPMGYGIPAAVGVSLARPSKHVVVVVGDGGFQMSVQELATIAEMELPITICLLNNQSLGIIKQWQELYYDGSFQVELDNPDFVKLANAYHIKALMIDSPGDIFAAVQEAVKLNKPVLIEIRVDENEDIPFPR